MARKSFELQETVFQVGKLAVQQVETPLQPAGSPPLATAPEEFCSLSLGGVVQFITHLPEGHSFQLRVFGQLQCLCIRVPWSPSLCPSTEFVF